MRPSLHLNALPQRHSLQCACGTARALLRISLCVLDFKTVNNCDGSTALDPVRLFASIIRNL